MLRDYQIVSPSLEGVLSESSLTYEGLKRPIEILRFFDGPSSKGRVRKEGDPEGKVGDEGKGRVLEEYFHDLYGIFMKKLSYFIVQPESTAEESVKLQAMLQEMIKIKALLGKV